MRILGQYLTCFGRRDACFVNPWSECKGMEYEAGLSLVAAFLLCRKKRDLEEEEAEGASSGEDEFYDRTMETKKKRSKAAAHVEDAASLYGRKVRGCD